MLLTLALLAYMFIGCYITAWLWETVGSHEDALPADKALSAIVGSLCPLFGAVFVYIWVVEWWRS